MTKPSLHILIIEDNNEDLSDLRQKLLIGGNRRYRFSDAKLGVEGFKMILNPEHVPYDCVLLDYDLPDIDAPEMLAMLSKGAAMLPCPVIVALQSPKIYRLLSLCEVFQLCYVVCGWY